MRNPSIRELKMNHALRRQPRGQSAYPAPSQSRLRRGSLSCSYRYRTLRPTWYAHRRGRAELPLRGKRRIYREVSPTFLAEMGVRYVILGHSERREYFGRPTRSSTERSGLRCPAASSRPYAWARRWPSGRRRDGRLVCYQTCAALAGSSQQVGGLVIAYEPIWAIGTGKTATANDANTVMGIIRSQVRKTWGDAADRIRQYGGSMKPGNAAEPMAQPEIDGGLIGSASLGADDFAAIVHYQPKGTLMRKRPTVLIVMDGFGLAEPSDTNAIAKARKPNLDRLMAKYPTTSLRCQGMDVGLPDGQMGNSEVGHLNLGAGRIVYQPLTRVSKSILDGDFFSNPALTGAMEHVREHGTALHLMGLVSDGGVHSHIDHLLALVRMGRDAGIDPIFIHCFMDGRDVPPSSGKEYIVSLERSLAELGAGQIATVSGRFYAMDRDNIWERIAIAYNALTLGQALPPHRQPRRWSSPTQRAKPMNCATDRHTAGWPSHGNDRRKRRGDL